MAPRYHPGVIWGPFLLALALGLAVSAGLYFAYLWPQVEPDDEAIASPGVAGARSEPDDGAASDSKVADAADDAKAGPTETEAETEAAPPTRESSPA